MKDMFGWVPFFTELAQKIAAGIAKEGNAWLDDRARKVEWHVDDQDLFGCESIDPLTFIGYATARRRHSKAGLEQCYRNVGTVFDLSTSPLAEEAEAWEFADNHNIFVDKHDQGVFANDASLSHRLLTEATTGEVKSFHEGLGIDNVQVATLSSHLFMANPRAFLPMKEKYKNALGIKALPKDWLAYQEAIQNVNREFPQCSPFEIDLAIRLLQEHPPSSAALGRPHRRCWIAESVSEDEPRPDGAKPSSRIRVDADDTVASDLAPGDLVLVRSEAGSGHGICVVHSNDYGGELRADRDTPARRENEGVIHICWLNKNFCSPNFTSAASTPDNEQILREATEQDVRMFRDCETYTPTWQAVDRIDEEEFAMVKENVGLYLVRIRPDDEEVAFEKGFAIIGKRRISSLENNTNWNPMKRIVHEALQDAKPRQKAVEFGIMWNFAYKMGKGSNVVITPRRGQKMCAIGVVTSPYQFVDVNGERRHAVGVDWLKKDVPKAAFKSDLRAKFNTPMTACQIRIHEGAKRIKAILEGREDPGSEKVQTVTTDDEIGDVQHTLNRILYGPPGTGKTYETVRHAIAIIRGKSLAETDYDDAQDEFRELRESGRAASAGGISMSEATGEEAEAQLASAESVAPQIEFVTFHQNYAYEDFVEGIRPRLREAVRPVAAATVSAGPMEDLESAAPVDNVQELSAGTYVASEGGGDLQEVPPSGSSTLDYELRPGVFRRICKAAEDAQAAALHTGEKPPRFVLIIDEINRGNIAKIFGELITLIEESKRLGRSDELEVTLPYSGDSFGVPENLYLVGTMNTADRSIQQLDTALRRRFTFMEMMPQPDHDDISKDVEGVNCRKLLQAMNERIRLFDRERQIGHTYLLEVGDLESLADCFRDRIFPLLQEYFYDDWQKIRYVLGGNAFVEERRPVDGEYTKGLIDESDFADEDRKIYERLPYDDRRWKEVAEYRRIYEKSDKASNDES